LGLHHPIFKKPNTLARKNHHSERTPPSGAPDLIFFKAWADFTLLRDGKMIKRPIGAFQASSRSIFGFFKLWTSRRGREIRFSMAV
jgi:hypothetical protein